MVGFSVFISLILSSLFSTSTLWARDLPEDLCAASRCGDRQQAIFDRFMEEGIGVQDLRTEAVYSGVCHWGGLYRPTDEHHGGIFWYDLAGETAFRGRFSFYARTNPYESVTPEMARRDWFTNSQHYMPEIYEDFAFFDANPQGDASSRIWYWFRRDQKNAGLLYVVALMGATMTGVCELEMNE